MQISQYLSDVAELIEKTGDALKEYENLCGRVCSDADWARRRLANDVDLDGEIPAMTDEERAECQQFVDDADALKADVRKNIADLLKHNVVLTGVLCKYGTIQPAQDGLADAMQKIFTPHGDE